MLANEVLSFIEENDVKFIRLAFTDLFGRLRNIAILPDQLAPALESGVAIDATAVPGCAAAPVGGGGLKSIRLNHRARRITGGRTSVF